MSVERPPKRAESSENPYRHRYTFLEVFKGLFDRFLDSDSVLQLGDKYEELEYNTVGKAREFFTRLKYYVECMPSPPNTYEFKTRLMEGFPTDLRKKITDKGITAESSSVNKIMKNAVKLEEGCNAERHYAVRNRQKNAASLDQPKTPRKFIKVKLA
ncbi:hypothetical protein K435DRAFT_861648 [Dendrothele bispora CBS 962.96]|uniref:Retrotransposon gag domain-containing protein n=1 Tax=Dendrothele bispora (strain CBS 962.96) TaxID=1314807 RepID=A0A4S8LVT8_DENBC|nr:hypothetical protein K435DRAFT_861648 [Dendrothele bispora CBS 962.96]